MSLSVSKYMRGCNAHTKGMTLEDLEEGFNSNSGEDGKHDISIAFAALSN